jgi:hypothetical protein
MPDFGGARLPDAPILNIARGERFLARDGELQPTDTSSSNRLLLDDHQEGAHSAKRKQSKKGVKGVFSTASRFADMDPTRQRRAALERGAEDCLRPQRLQRILQRQIEMELAAASAAAVAQQHRDGDSNIDASDSDSSRGGGAVSAPSSLSGAKGVAVEVGGQLELDPREVGFTLTGLLHKDDTHAGGLYGEGSPEGGDGVDCADMTTTTTAAPAAPTLSKQLKKTKQPRNLKAVEGVESGDDTEDVGRMFHKHILRSRYGAEGLSVAAAGGRAAFAALGASRNPALMASPALTSTGATAPPSSSSRLGVTAADLMAVNVTRDDAAYRGTTGTESVVPGLPTLTSTAHAFGIDAARNFGDDACKPVPPGLRVTATFATLARHEASRIFKSGNPTTKAATIGGGNRGGRKTFAGTPAPRLSGTTTTAARAEAATTFSDAGSCQLPPLLVPNKKSATPINSSVPLPMLQAGTTAAARVAPMTMAPQKQAELRDAFGLRHAGRLAAYLNLDPADLLRAQRSEVRRTAEEMGAVLPGSPR